MSVLVELLFYISSQCTLLRLHAVITVAAATPIMLLHVVITPAAICMLHALQVIVACVQPQHRSLVKSHFFLGQNSYFYPSQTN